MAKEKERLPALLWDSLPEDAADHPDYMAIQALMYDESTEEEQAENFKEQGNQRLKVALKSKNKLYFQEAIRYYSQGIAIRLEDRPDLKSILYSNRAQAEIYMSRISSYMPIEIVKSGNWRKALNDGQEALKIDPSNLKAYFRGAQSAFKLDELETACRLCEGGLKQDPKNEALKQLQKDITVRMDIVAKQIQRAEEAKTALKKEAMQLMRAFEKRKIRLCQSNFKVGKLKPFVDSEGILHWPVLFVYPETMQQDIIEDVLETNRLSDLLDVMFSPDAEPLKWDTSKAYRRDTINVYYLANAGEPYNQNEMMTVLMGQYRGDSEDHAPQLYGEKAAYFIEADEQKHMQEIYSQDDCIIPGVPTFFVVAKGTNYHQRFLESVSRD